ncbi:MAG: RcpC/CpaB family pilus assembly protein [Acidimicrobiales bacterium]
MNSRRSIILIIAVAVGALAALGVTMYIRDVEDSVWEGKELSSAWIVTQPIEKGTSADLAIQQEMIQLVELPAEYVPATKVTDPLVELSGLVAVSQIPANSIIVEGQFVPPAVVTTGVTDRLEDMEMVTVTLQIDQVGGAAYLIEPGDFVNIMVKYDIPEPEAAEGEEELPTPQITGTDRSEIELYDLDVRYAYQKAEVLVVDKALAADLGDAEDEEAAGVAGNKGLITLAVPPEVAQELISIGIERLYLSLVPSNYEPYAIEPVDIDERVLAGEDDTRLTPAPESDEELPSE